MQTHDLIQGSPEWLAYRRDHFNASDAPAMLGCSPYKRRDALLREMATGIGEEVDEATQRRFDAGHRFEANARKLAEELLGEDLFPVVGSQGRYSASLDGLTMLGEICWEHKTLNRELREVFADIETIAPEHREHSGGKSLPLHYQVQMEQQLMVSGASKCLFTASRWADDGTLLEASHCWYHPDPELRTRIVAGWEQFESELAAYAPDETKAAPVVGRTPENLPALLIQVSGAVTASNLGEFKEHALAVLGSINRELKTDQDFATAESTVKWCADVESRLAAAKEHALSQTATIEEVFRAIDDISAEARRVRLELDKLVKARKEEIRGEIVAGGVSAFREHIAALNVRLGRPYMPTVPADFASAIKGKRTVDSLRGAVNDELARAKIAANEIADRIQLNLTTLRELASEHAFLFADTATIVLKAADDLTTLVKARIAEHEAAKAAQLEVERERIRAEEQAKAQREAREAEDRRERERQEELRQQALEAEREAQAGIAAAREEEALPTPLLDDLSSLAKDLKNDIVSEIDAAQAISAAQRTAAAAPAVAPLHAAAVVPATPPSLKLGQITERLGFPLSADFLRSLGFEPAAKVGAHGVYHESQFPHMLAALVRHIEGVQAKAAA